MKLIDKHNLQKVKGIGIFVLWAVLAGAAVFFMAVGSLAPVDFIYDGI
ncbi:MAG: hypothetical protein AAFX54_07820 [Pseudomonadota bacterium]